MENSSEYYYARLTKDEKPGAILAAFYCTLYNIPLTRSEVMLCNKLVKTFGRFIVFNAILDLAQSYPEKIENVYPLLFSICKRRFEVTHVDSTIVSREDLRKYIDEIDKQIEDLKGKKIRNPSSKGLE